MYLFAAAVPEAEETKSFFSSINLPTLFYALITLVICPMIPVYGEGNFCMRASIPGLVMLYLFVIHSLEKSRRERRLLHLGLLSAVLLTGALTAQHEFNRSIKETFDASRAGTPTRLEATAPEEILLLGNESTSAEDNLFYRYLARGH